MFAARNMLIGTPSPPPSPSPGISIVDTATAAADTVTMPTHDVGDLILVWATRNNATPPTEPAGQGWQLVRSQVGTAISGILHGKIATANNHTTGTWTNATGISIVVVHGSAGIAILSSTAGNSNSISYGALTQDNTDGTSWQLRFGAHSTATNLTSNPPTNAPNTLLTGTANRNVIWSSNGGTVGGGLLGTQSVNASAGWIQVPIELIDGESGGADFTDTFATLDTTRYAAGSTGASITISGSALRFTSTASTGNSVLRSREAWDFTNRSFAFNAQAIAATTRKLSCGLVSLLGPGLIFPAISGVIVRITNGQASAVYITNGTETTVGTARTHTAGDWYRIRHSAGTIFWEFGTNGTSWTAWQNSSAFPLPLNWRIVAGATFTATSLTFDIDNFTLLT